MSAKAKQEGKTVRADDWFSGVDEELEQKKLELREDYREVKTRRAEINRNLISDFWKIWTTFNKNGVHFSMEPNYTAFGQFDEFPYGDWRFKPDFSLDAVETVQLSDRTQDQGRLGDTLKAFYHKGDRSESLRLIFEFCEGEHYYKYSGWKRIYTQHLLYNKSLDNVQIGEIHDILKKVVKAWFESHLKKDRNLFLKHIQNNYEKLSTYSQ